MGKDQLRGHVAYDGHFATLSAQLHGLQWGGTRPRTIAGGGQSQHVPDDQA